MAGPADAGTAADAYFKEIGLGPVPRYDGDAAARRHEDRRPGRDPGADHDRRRLSGIHGDRHGARELLLIALCRRGRAVASTGGGGARMSGVDPVTLAVIANRLDSIVREMENTLLRTGRSAVLNMARDFSCALITGDNRLLASAEGLPVHVIGMEFLAEAVTDLHDDLDGGRRVPAQRPLPRQHAPGRPRDPRAGLLGGAASLHRCGEGAPGRLRERAADHLHALRTRRLRGGQSDLPGRARAARLPATSTT